MSLQKVKRCFLLFFLLTFALCCRRPADDCHGQELLPLSPRTCTSSLDPLGRPLPAAQRPKRSGADYRALWKTAIHQQILLLRMEKENQRLEGKQLCVCDTQRHRALERIPPLATRLGRKKKGKELQQCEYCRILLRPESAVPFPPSNTDVYNLSRPCSRSNGLTLARIIFKRIICPPLFTCRERFTPINTFKLHWAQLRLYRRCEGPRVFGADLTRVSKWKIKTLHRRTLRLLPVSVALRSQGNQILNLISMHFKNCAAHK